MTVHDLVGVGIGPFNLSLAALADPLDIDAAFFEAKEAFSWHPGLLLEDTRLQVPFLADLVTMVDPTSRWSFLSYLQAHDRLFPFYFYERFHILRREYDAYCRWVSSQLETCHFGHTVTAVRWADDLFRVNVAGPDGERSVLARNIVLGVGTVPVIPEALRHLPRDHVFHAADYLEREASSGSATDVVVIGSGQSGAEVFVDLLRNQTSAKQKLIWLTSSRAFAPMEYSKLGLEHFTPDYSAYFRSLPAHARDQLLPEQWQLYKGISGDLIAEIYDLLYERSIGDHRPNVLLCPETTVRGGRVDAALGIELACRHNTRGDTFVVKADAVICATGFAAEQPSCLAPLADLVIWDNKQRFQVDEHYRVALSHEVEGGLYVQNAELHTHGVGTPDLGLGAHRAAVILNSVLSKAAYHLPSRTAFTTFGGLTPGSMPT